MKRDLQKLKLLPQELLTKTSSIDHADWNYKPLLSIISRKRFYLIKKLLDSKHGEKLLEIGYGSGIFLPDLSKYADEIYGVDVHQKQVAVTEKLNQSGINAELKSGGAESLDWCDNFFDFIIVVSALEFVDNLDRVCLEVKRTLKPNGSFFVVTPGKSPLLDFGLKILTGENAKDDFADRREIILPTLGKHFKTKRELAFPKYGSSIIKLYTALELKPEKSNF